MKLRMDKELLRFRISEEQQTVLRDCKKISENWISGKMSGTIVLTDRWKLDLDHNAEGFVCFNLEVPRTDFDTVLERKRRCEGAGKSSLKDLECFSIVSVGKTDVKVILEIDCFSLKKNRSE